jgi:hypothetical protein
VVVNHVQNYADAQCVRCVDERTQVVGRAIETGGREQADPVISPAESARKIIHWHHLDQGDPDLAQERELLSRSLPGTLGGEGSNMHLVDGLSFNSDTRPTGVGPGVAVQFSHLGRTMRPLRLAARGWIWAQLLAIEPEAIAGAHDGFRMYAGEISPWLTEKQVFLPVFKHYCDGGAGRGPYPEGHTVVDWLRADGAPAAQVTCHMRNIIHCQPQRPPLALP